MNTSILVALLKDVVQLHKGGEVGYLKGYLSASEEIKLSDIHGLLRSMGDKSAHVSLELSEALVALTNGLLDGDSHVETYCAYIAQQTSARNATNMLRSVAKHLVQDYADIIIETAAELSQEDQSSMKLHLLKEYPLSCPRFTTHPQLLGGARMFLGGVLYDASWRGEVSKLFTSLSVS